MACVPGGKVTANVMGAPAAFASSASGLRAAGSATTLPFRPALSVIACPLRLTIQGAIIGFLGEPWNARAVADGLGFTAITCQEIRKDHPEKVCAFTQEFADKNPKTVKAVLKGLHDASIWLDDLKNRPEQCEIVSRANYINCPPEIILGRLQGKYDYGDGRTKQDPDYMIFHDRNCNYPQLKYAVWFLSQFRRWGMIEAGIDYQAVAQQVMRPDLYEEAMREIGYQHGGPNHEPETLFDGVAFDPTKPEEYAKSFAVHSIKG